MKIVILGTTGSGKTTLARKISKELGIPHVELDALNWDPNWQQVDDVLFRDRVKEAISGEKWVVDGNYSRAGHDLIWPRADVAIWLDYPLGFQILSSPSPDLSLPPLQMPQYEVDSGPISSKNS